MSQPLDQAHVLLTGATGFVGQAVLEKLLSAYPSTRVSVLVRPRGDLSAEQRVAKLLRKPVFKAWRRSVGEESAAAAFAERVSVISGDLGDLPPLPDDVDVVLHSASTVSFDLPVDEAFAANVGGPISLYEALAATGADPHVVHVSTSYVAGLRKGVAEERALDHEIDREVELASAVAAREAAEKESRTPEVLGRLLREAEKEHRRAGARAVAEAAETARSEWVREQLVEHGRTRALSLGWPDVYTFTKAMGERVAEEMWAGAGHRLSVVRPTIIESSLRHPYPGWIDGFKVADPLIAAYGRGLLPEFPALADTVLDIIPVDFVVNAILAAAAAPPAPGGANYYQVSSGITNPLRLGSLVHMVREYFSANPLKDAEGAHVAVPAWSFPHRGAVERALGRRELAVDVADRALGYLPANRRTRQWISALYKARRDLGTLRKFTSLYQPYTQTEVIFDDARTRALHAALPAERQAEHGFDVAEIDWRHYLLDVHIPGVPGLMRDRTPKEAPGAPAELPRRKDVLAVFDLQRTVAAATLVEQYLWVELAAKPASRWPASLANLVALGPRYLQAERRDRGDFIRTFMRRYEGASEQELRAVIARKVTPSLRRGLLVEAVERIRAHREAGHRTVLVTGEIDVFVEPLAPLFDEIVAGRMETDGDGRWTGHLATSPLVGEARAAWLRRYAREQGMDLTGSYAYGDSYADRPWLEVVGYPNAVNPDAGLYRYARARRWPTHQWTATAEGRLTPVLRSIKGERQ
ncbi:HAD superfamily hydrolase (TIGR01490 family) [Georgenia soli]|uniref:HAD superfamily hydrolase (TIGR01490 family) n=1 Tax=Georgenia soli TaxID=638953 RepID=A0A2A9ELN0_9MICO|nr:HAD-IB family hydrolase [Georgenia soli]PFG39172.1 HAD superfamily hydrolase (TIGR01490 family) [Georgenia soli]